MREFQPTTPDEEASAITRLADGTLTDAERPAVEAWAEAHPEILQRVQSDRRVAQVLATGGPQVPDHLLAGIEAKMQSAPRARRQPRGRWFELHWRPVAGALAAGVAAVIAVVVIAGGDSAAPGHGITTAASLAYAPATAGPVGARSATLLDVSYGGITYPNYARQFGAVPAGERVDTIDGRRVLTVFYKLPDGTRLSYSIFNGAPLSLPSSTKTYFVRGVPLHVFTTANGLQVVTLVRNGRTCVLAVPAAHHEVEPYAAWPLQVSSA